MTRTEKYALLVLGACVISLVALIWYMDSLFFAPYRNRPEQHVHIEVAQKRICKYTYDTITYTYIIAFKFADGSVKELEVGTDDRRIFDSIHEDETGMLIYRERADIETHIKNENLRYDGRIFIGFEKDPAYGGLKLRTGRLPVETETALVWLALLVCVLVLLLCGVVIVKKPQLSK